MRNPLAFTLLALAAAALPALAHAEPCQFQAPRNATLDLAGVRTLVVKVHQHDVHIDGSAAMGGQIRGRACASAQSLLPALQVTQRRQGDRLIVEATDGNEANHTWSWFGSRYHYLDLQLAIPASLTVEVEVGSGDAQVARVARLKASVGSGSLGVRGVQGDLDASVNSGDIKAADIGSVHVGAVGSGDFSVAQVHGAVAVGSVGSGDFTAKGVQGDVRIDAIGSGDATANAVTGSVVVGAVGSGDLHVKDVGHDLRVASVGSGDVEHSGVAGTVQIPRQD
ncbi:MAG: DUF4097 family beta strand repeat protein [Proteobacteria bacterium]|nr:DUF4097 family beta strand repeat protein [Pseudomonadota bacterium]